MNQTGREWQSLADVWQAQAAPPVDVDALRREVRRRDRHLRWSIAAEIAMAVIAAGLCFYVAWLPDASTAEQALFYGLGALMLGYQAWVVRLRWRDLGDGGRDVQSMLALETRRCHSTLAYWRWGMWTALVLLLGIYGLLLGGLFLGWNGLSLDGLAGGLLANVVLFPLVGLYGWWRSRESRRRLAWLQGLRAQLGEP